MHNSPSFCDHRLLSLIQNYLSQVHQLFRIDIQYDHVSNNYILPSNYRIHHCTMTLTILYSVAYSHFTLCNKSYNQLLKYSCYPSILLNFRLLVITKQIRKLLNCLTWS